jgi:PAS domain S-box-containing protein
MRSSNSRVQVIVEVNSSQLLNPRLISKLKTGAIAASLMAIFVGCLVLVGWMFDIPTFKSIIPGLASMKANTALCFFLSGVSLLLQATHRKDWIKQLCAFALVAIALLTGSQYLFNWNIGIDQLLFQDTSRTFYPGRMAPNSALNFILIGFALLLLGQKNHRPYKFAHFLTLAAALISGLALIGYAYEVESLYKISWYTSMALHTAMTFTVLCVGILLAQPDQGLMKIITSKGMGGYLARRLLIAAIAIPFVLGWLINQGQQAGLYTPTFGLSLLVVANITIFAVLICQNAQRLDRLDHRRQQVEEELQDTLATLQALIQASPLAIISLDTEGKLKLWSPAAERIFGWTEQEVLGRLAPFVPEDQLEEFRQLHQARLQGNAIADLEAQRQKKDGSQIDVAIWAAPLHDMYGNISSTMAIIADITERKRTEAALRASEERFRQLAENIQDVFWIADLKQQQLLYVSPAYEQIWGRSYKSVLENSKGWLDTIHPDDRNLLQDSFSARLQSGSLEDMRWEEFDRTFRIVRPDGTVRWIRDRGFPIKNELGEIQRIAGIAEDITERKRTEAELQETTQTLQALIQACPLGITVFSLDDGKVKLWNPAAETIFGWSEQEALGDFLPTVPEDKLEDFLANLSSVRQGQQLIGIEARRQKKGGLPIDINVWAAPLIDAKGNVSCMTIVADISDRKRLEEERNRLLKSEQAARSAAEAANRMKDEFLAVLSHELRTPMNAILGWTQLLRTRKFDAIKIEQALEVIDRNSKSLSQLIEDVLDVSKVVRGKLQLNMRPVELVGVIEAAIETVHPAAMLKEIRIESLLDHSVGLVLGDGNRLQQVIWNLLSNAVKFTPRGGRIEVKLSAFEGDLPGVSPPIQEGVIGLQSIGEAADQYVQIQVKDTGKGIAPQFLPHVFERFRQENSSTTRTYGGLGLGLAIVRHLVELHGGTVLADSAGEGEGATFSMILPFVSPLTDVNVPTPFSSIEAGGFRDDVPALDGLRVLVVDDEADARELVGTMLRQYGIEVTEVASASEGLEALRRLKPNVLISDIGMPLEDGYALMRKVRALAADDGGAIPAVALTAYAREEDQKNAIAAGFQQHLPKPVNPVKLLEIIANLAGRDGKV